MTDKHKSKKELENEGKETVEKRIELPYSEIKEAIVTITF